MNISTKDAYSKWVSSRSSLVVPGDLAVNFDSEWARFSVESSHYPRLRVAEESARSWYTGVVAFRQDVRDLVGDSELGWPPRLVPSSSLT
ncbi:hypothetical protein N7497_011172 [Penicillium chrysogenum]|uniref:Uncharacterized protein n=1 Tax=Penicillium chrysogenum TaxID=5076 RepID=A0ABQ8W7U7_PENCH|nr:hypothetical protein N7505_009393 [Penicillium chrysogenum]KAJ6142073.1 hypothetical protein N7497_011172 [Penicillium chrysogenum]